MYNNKIYTENVTYKLFTLAENLRRPGKSALPQILSLCSCSLTIYIYIYNL
jgi:hypothetical protein